MPVSHPAMTGIPTTQIVLDKFLTKDNVDHAGLIHQPQLWVKDSVPLPTITHGSNSPQFQWLTVPWMEDKETDVTETLLPMLITTDKLTEWSHKDVSHSKLQFGLLVDLQDVPVQETEPHHVTLMINVPPVTLWTHNILLVMVEFTHVKTTSWTTFIKMDHSPFLLTAILIYKLIPAEFMNIQHMPPMKEDMLWN